MKIEEISSFLLDGIAFRSSGKPAHCIIKDDIGVFVKPIEHTLKSPVYEGFEKYFHLNESQVAHAYSLDVEKISKGVFQWRWKKVSRKVWRTHQCWPGAYIAGRPMSGYKYKYLAAINECIKRYIPIPKRLESLILLV